MAAATNNIWMEILVSEAAAAQAQFESDGYEAFDTDLVFLNTGVGPAEKLMISIWGAAVPVDIVNNIVGATSASSVAVGAWLTIDGSQVPGIAYDDPNALSHMPDNFNADTQTVEPATSVIDVIKLSGQVLRDFTPPPPPPSGFSSGFSGGFS